MSYKHSASMEACCDLIAYNGITSSLTMSWEVIRVLHCQGWSACIEEQPRRTHTETTSIDWCRRSVATGWLQTVCVMNIWHQLYANITLMNICFLEIWRIGKHLLMILPYEYNLDLHVVLSLHLALHFSWLVAMVFNVWRNCEQFDLIWYIYFNFKLGS